jgi:3-dehydroquinate dehydratase type I
MKTKPKFGVIGSVMESSMLKLTTVIYSSRQASSVEIRLDPLKPKFGLFIPTLAACLEKLFLTQPVILTLRSKNQGGSEDISPEEQFYFWENLPANIREIISAEQSAVFVDWGLDLIMYAGSRTKQIFPWKKIGASLHDFQETPDDLPDRLQMLEETKAAAFLKLATTVTDRDNDIPRISNLFCNRSDERPLIAFGMGALGEDTRRKCLGWGSAGTYGYFSGHAKSAPGQLSIQELLRDPEVQAALGK